MVDGNYSGKQVSLFVTLWIFICLFSKKLIIIYRTEIESIEVFELKRMQIQNCLIISSVCLVNV